MQFCENECREETAGEGAAIALGFACFMSDLTYADFRQMPLVNQISFAIGTARVTSDGLIKAIGYFEAYWGDEHNLRLRYAESLRDADSNYGNSGRWGKVVDPEIEVRHEEDMPAKDAEVSPVMQQSSEQ